MLPYQNTMMVHLFGPHLHNQAGSYICLPEYPVQQSIGYNTHNHIMHCNGINFDCITL